MSVINDMVDIDMVRLNVINNKVSWWLRLYG